jgi:hypothetical protein
LILSETWHAAQTADRRGIILATKVAEKPAPVRIYGV